MEHLIRRSWFSLLLLMLVAPLQAQSFDGLIIADVSGSLRGFATASPQDLETLYRVIYRNFPNPQFAIMPGAGGPTQRLELAQIRSLRQPHIYTGQSTPLDLVIKQVASQGSITAIVTDGLVSDNLYLRLQEAMAPLARDGWGIWLLLLPLQFKGSYDLEQPLNIDLHYARMQSCVQNHQPPGRVALRDGALQSVNYEGIRPLVLFLLEKEPESGRSRAMRIQEELKRELPHAPLAVELSPLYLREYAIGTPVARSLGIALAGDRIESENTVTQTIVAAPQDGGPLKRLTIPLSWKRSSPSPFIQPYEEQWKLEPVGKIWWGEARIDRKADMTKLPGGLVVTLNSEMTWGEWLRSWIPGSPVIRAEALTFQVTSILEKEAAGWWEGWSSETTWECPQKVFKLTVLIKQISGLARDRLKAKPPREIRVFKLQIGTS